MRITLPHRFSRSDAVRRVKQALAEGRPQMEGKVSVEKEEWHGDTLHFAFTGQGQHISGTLEVKDEEFLLEAKLPLMLRMFEGHIQKAIEQETKKLIG